VTCDPKNSGFAVCVSLEISLDTRAAAIHFISCRLVLFRINPLFSAVIVTVKNSSFI
jgi:hypothetical protein